MNIIGIGLLEKQLEVPQNSFKEVIMMYNKYNFIDACYTGEKIVFKYKNITYIVNKVLNDSDYQDENYYLYDSVTETYQFFDGAERLINNAKVGKSCLCNVLDELEIVFIDYNTKKEFISANLMNREIEFNYNGVEYFRSQSDKGYYIWCQKDDSVQYYQTPEELLECATLEGKPLKELWDEINISCIL